MTRHRKGSNLDKTKHKHALEYLDLQLHLQPYMLFFVEYLDLIGNISMFFFVVALVYLDLQLLLQPYMLFFLLPPSKQTRPSVYLLYSCYAFSILYLCHFQCPISSATSGCVKNQYVQLCLRPFLANDVCCSKVIYMLNQLIGLLFQVIDFHYQTSIKLKLQTHGSDFILLYVLATFFCFCQ